MGATHSNRLQYNYYYELMFFLVHFVVLVGTNAIFLLSLNQIHHLYNSNTLIVVYGNRF